MPVPALSDLQRKTFLRFRLLGPVDSTELNEGTEHDQADPRLRDVQRQIAQAQTREEIVSVTQSAAPEALEKLYETAIERQHEIETPRELDHILVGYHSMLPANPRAITRFVMAFAVTSAARSIENRWLPTDALARWIVVRTRWPALADFLRMSPESIEVGGPRLPDELQAIPDLEEAARILVEDQKPFTVARLRDCAGSPLSL